MKNLYSDAFADPSKDYAYNLLYHDFPILHNHNYWEFLIVLSGEYKHTINGREELINRGQVCVCKDRVHSRDRFRGPSAQQVP